MDYAKRLRLLQIKDIQKTYNDQEIMKSRIKSYNMTLSKKKPVEFINYTPYYIGKVRSLYFLSDNINDYKDTFEKLNLYTNRYDKIAMKISNKLSGFDRFLCTVPLKGLVLDSISSWWFKQTSHIVPNHILNDNYNYITVSKKCTIFPVEFVMRSYMTGTTNTSIWQNYKNHIDTGIVFCGNEIRSGYKKNDKLDQVILTPTTKSNEHDAPTNTDDIITSCVMSEKHMGQCIEYAFKLFDCGQKNVQNVVLY